jgi:hypothetical protein
MTRLTFASILCLCSFAPQSSAQSPDSPSLQALVTEIHQLRLAVERTGAATPKIHITLLRLQLQEQRVTRISEQLADVRKQIAASSERNPFPSTFIQSLNTKLDQEQDATRKKAIEEQVHQMTAMMEQQGRMLQQMRTQEAELAASLRIEQAKAEELNDHLAALERTLDAPAK